MSRGSEDVEVLSILVSLREVRERFGITQKELSERAGVTQTQVSRMENLSFMPRLDTIIKVANCLNVEIKLTSPFSDDYYYSKVKSMTDVHRFYKQGIENFELIEESVVDFISYENYKKIIGKYDDLFNVVQRITKAEQNNVLYVMSVLVEDCLVYRMTGEERSEEKVDNLLERYSLSDYSVARESVILVMGTVYELVEELVIYIDDFTLSYSEDRVSKSDIAVNTINVIDVEFGEKVLMINRDTLLENLNNKTEYEAIIDYIGKEYSFDVVSSQEDYEKNLSLAKRGNVVFIVDNVMISRERAERTGEEFRNKIREMNGENN